MVSLNRHPVPHSFCGRQGVGANMFTQPLLNLCLHRRLHLGFKVLMPMVWDFDGCGLTAFKEKSLGFKSRASGVV